MSVEQFSKLKEIDSLTKMRFGHLKAISEQDDRLTKLNTRLDENQSESHRIQQETFSLQQKMHELEQRLKLLQKQRQNLMDIGESGEKYDTQIDELETQGLTLLDDIESNGKQLRDHKEFETGLRKTMAEIEKEALDIKNQETRALENIALRLTLLEEGLPSSFREILKKVQAKNLAHGPFTRNEAGSCYFCRYKISRIDESEIDLQQQLKQCPQCSRIFLPYGS